MYTGNSNLVPKSSEARPGPSPPQAPRWPRRTPLTLVFTVEYRSRLAERSWSSQGCGLFLLFSEAFRINGSHKPFPFRIPCERGNNHRKLFFKGLSLPEFFQLFGFQLFNLYRTAFPLTIRIESFCFIALLLFPLGRRFEEYHRGAGWSLLRQFDYSLSSNMLEQE